ncbi:hypothetical protein G6016_06115 [Dietzia aerolata]|uniref:5'-nucleotidase C-terminal domain-containing protein n=1 Tax=Dietzia aerolata TaxID=595984 RepID=A0ABV5JPS4_9ACTN|nr:hypothetical protein [Dietzia aerolata]
MVLEVDPETGDVTGHTQENVEVPGEATDADLNNPVVSEVKKIVDETLAEAEVVGSQSIGTVTADITTAHSGGERDDRLSESTLGNLVGQFLVEAVEERGGADIGFMNPGGLRDELRNDPAGENGNITLAETNGVLPFANTLVTLDLSDLDLTSLGAPTTGAVDVTLGGADLGTFTAVSGVDNTTFGPAGHHTPLDGHVVIDVTIPAGTPAGETALIVTTDTGTVIPVPVTVA